MHLIFRNRDMCETAFLFIHLGLTIRQPFTIVDYHLQQFVTKNNKYILTHTVTVTSMYLNICGSVYVWMLVHM